MTSKGSVSVPATAAADPADIKSINSELNVESLMKFQEMKRNTLC